MKRRISADKCVVFHMRTLPLLYLCSSRLYLRQLRRIAVLQLIFAYIAVMLPSSLTVGVQTAFTSISHLSLCGIFASVSKSLL